MTYIPDGSHINYSTRRQGVEDPNLFSWGWLGDSVPSSGWKHPKLKGLFSQCIMGLKVHSRYRGSHTCEICGKSSISNGSRSFTHEGITYQCPAGVDHYLSDHDYKPPQQVMDAVAHMIENALNS